MRNDLKLPEGWEPYKGTSRDCWDEPTPWHDIAAALDVAGDHHEAFLGGAVCRVHLTDIVEVAHAYISYHGATWAPGEGAGSELELAVVVRLRDGRWAAIEGWNDYTGWGCQDGADVRVGFSEEDVIRGGLTQEARAKLGLVYEDEGVAL